jgi:hypothetical protein
MTTILGKERGTTQNIVFTTSDDTMDIDLGYAYEKFVIALTPTEAAKLHADTALQILIDGNKHWRSPVDGAVFQMAKPGSLEGVYLVIDAGFVREFTISLGIAPGSTTTMQVFGLNRITIPTDEILVQRTIPI